MWKSFRILLSEKCNASCPNCFNKDSRGLAELSISNLDNIFAFLYSIGVEKIKIMGGEPTTHSDFLSCYQMSQRYFRSVMLFTNALNECLLDIMPRDNDVINYNFNFISSKPKEKIFLLDKPGARGFEIQITENVNIDFLKHKLAQIKSIINDRTIHLFITLDCTSNIFLNKSIIHEKWNSLISYISNDKQFEWHLDHIIPKCFYEGEIFLRNFPSKKCNIFCAGLIDANLNMRFCNQYNEVICRFEEFKQMSINERIECYSNFYYKKISEQKKCSECISFNTDCNGGCFMHKLGTTK